MNTCEARDQYRRYLEIIPYYCQSGLVNFIEMGKLPGEFLTAVLANDFRLALLYADQTNMQALHEYAVFVTNGLPTACHGSKDAVLRWNRIGGLRGMEKAAA